MNVALLISGGVDSSVALRLLQQQGHQVTAFYLKIWLEDELSFLGECPWEEDLSFVRAVCEQAGVPLEVISFQKEYWDSVVADIVDQIRQGLTPNPDILCNQRVKFGAFYAYIDMIYRAQNPDKLFDKIATGHYAQVTERDGIFYLKQSPDVIKDQTYFLSRLNQKQLARALFPIGHLKKAEVRDLAEQFNLLNKKRKDSQGICFLGKLKFSEFVKYHMGEKQGDIVEFETGKKLGTHQGVWFYTIGQRQGIGLSGGPWYIVDKNSSENSIFVSRSYHTADKGRDIVSIGLCHWISGYRPLADIMVKLRHGSHIYQATVQQQTKAGDSLIIKLPYNDQGIAAGQYAVFYEKDVCLGGGVITRL